MAVVSHSIALVFATLTLVIWTVLAVHDYVRLDRSALPAILATAASLGAFVAVGERVAWVQILATVAMVTCGFSRALAQR